MAQERREKPKRSDGQFCNQANPWNEYNFFCRALTINLTNCKYDSGKWKGVMM